MRLIRRDTIYAGEGIAIDAQNSDDGTVFSLASAAPAPPPPKSGAEVITTSHDGLPATFNIGSDGQGWTALVL